MGHGDAQVHRSRRRAIIEEHPEVLKLTGPDSRTQYYAYAVFAMQLFLAWAVSSSMPAAIVMGVVVSPYMGFAALVLMHETCHGLVFKEGAFMFYNRLLGILCNSVLLMPISEIMRQHHNVHHFDLGNVKKDVDVPHNYEVKWVGTSSFRKTLWLGLNIIVLPARSMAKLPVCWNRFVVFNWAVCLSFTLSAFLYSQASFAYLLLGLVLSQSIHPANARQVQRHIKIVDKLQLKEPALDAAGKIAIHDVKLNTFSYYGSLNPLTLNVGYHVEHHDFSNIAWTRLPELHNMAGEKWYAKSAAYSSRGFSDIVSFIFDPKTTLGDFAAT